MAAFARIHNNRLSRWCGRLGLALPLVCAAATATAAESWVGSGTHALETVSGVAREELAAGEPVHVVVSLVLRNSQELDALVGELSREGSPAYGRFLSNDQYLARYAPTAAQAQTVADHLRQAGFVHVEIAPNRLLVAADGTAATVRSAFQTRLAHFDVGGRSAYGNLDDAIIPQHLGGVVQAVLGLQNVEQFHILAQRAEAVKPQAQAAAHGIDPKLFPQLYGAAGLATGLATPVGIISEGDLTQTLADLKTFETQEGLPLLNPTVVPVGAASTDTSGTPEWDLDSQDIQAMAGGQVGQLIFYDTTSLSNSDITAAYNKAMNDGTAKVINVSLGECETNNRNDGSLVADDQIFKSAIAKGQTFSVSSGDSGSHECFVLFNTRFNTKQSYPASSPYVVVVGGTSLYTDTSGQNYSSESAWSGGGGGPSTQEAKPSWQGSVVPGGGRGVPDLALDADPNTGAIIIVNGAAAQYGGTSLASPLFVGLWARLQSANGNSLVYPDPSFYKYIPTNPALVHDVTTGSNGPPNGYYNAGRGWDFCTGFGSPIGSSLGSFIAAHSGF